MYETAASHWQAAWSNAENAGPAAHSQTMMLSSCAQTGAGFAMQLWAAEMNLLRSTELSAFDEDAR